MSLDESNNRKRLLDQDDDDDGNDNGVVTDVSNKEPRIESKNETDNCESPESVQADYHDLIFEQTPQSIKELMEKKEPKHDKLLQSILDSLDNDEDLEELLAPEDVRADPMLFEVLVNALYENLKDDGESVGDDHGWINYNLTKALMLLKRPEAVKFIIAAYRHPHWNFDICNNQAENFKYFMGTDCIPQLINELDAKKEMNFIILMALDFFVKDLYNEDESEQDSDTLDFIKESVSQFLLSIEDEDERELLADDALLYIEDYIISDSDSDNDDNDDDNDDNANGFINGDQKKSSTDGESS